MATNAAFRIFLQDLAIGLNAGSAREVVDEHGINTMKRLANLNLDGVKDLASLIRKQRVLGMPPLPDRFMLFPANAVRMLHLASTIAKNMERVCRVIVLADLLTIMRDTDRLEMHEQQIEIEKDQDNTLGGSYFEPLTEKIVHEQGSRPSMIMSNAPWKTSTGKPVECLWHISFVLTFTLSLRLMSPREILTLLMRS